MPKLQGIEDKYINGIKVDKENKDVFFNDETHKYYDKKTMQPYISVTQIVGKYSQEFDENFWSSYKALEAILEGDVFSIIKPLLLATKRFDNRLLSKYNIDEKIFQEKKNEILLEYKTKRDEACEHGTNEHLKKELSFYNRSNFDFHKYGFDEAGEFECRENYYTLDLENGVYPEFLIAINYKGLRLSGQVDLMIKRGNNIYICDWKGLDINTPILTTDGWKTMGTLTLLDKVFDCEGNPTKIKHISEEHHNPCYKITFDNGDSLIADEDHRWPIYFNQRKQRVMTTKELNEWLVSNERVSKKIPKILNPKPLNIEKKELPIDPYVLGVWLGDGTSDCGAITQKKGSKIWNELKSRGYKIGENLIHDPKRKNTEYRTIFELRCKLQKLGVLNNKHIPVEYLLASYEQRLDLLRGLMDTDGFLHKKRKRFIMETSHEWQATEFTELLCSLGFKPTVFNTVNKCDGKEFPGWMVCWTDFKVNPFLTRNQEEFSALSWRSNKNSFRVIKSVDRVDTVTTKCIEVESSSHTYLAGKHLIPTHNTNREIKKVSYYDKNKKSNVMMKYPLNNLMDVNYWHYALQLGTYAFMCQQINPDFKIEKLNIVHIDRDGKETIYPIEYKKQEVERMLNHYIKHQKIQAELDEDKPIEI